MIQNILVFGACSAIAQATYKKFKNANFLLVARDEKKLSFIAQDLTTRGALSVKFLSFDLADINKSLFSKINELMPEIDLLFIAHGYLPEQEKCNQDFTEAAKAFQINLISPCAILNHYANYFEQKKSGTIAVITSVAGERGRQSNYVYGAAKGALSIYLSGLRSRLDRSKICVLDIRPGFISSPMTTHLKQGILFSSTELAGDRIKKAIDKKQNVAYIPSFWFFIMLSIKLIPEFIFKKLKI